jgi:hypothetical protein
MLKFTSHPVYIFFIVFGVIPIDTLLIQRGDVLVGIFFMAMQVPWLIISVIMQLKKQ